MEGGLKKILVASLLAAALTPSAASAAPTRQQYIAQVEPTCTGYAQAQAVTGNQAFRDLGRLRGRKARRGFIRLGQLGNAEVAAIAQYQPPAGDEGLITAWLNSMHIEAVLVGRMGKPAKGFRPKIAARFLQVLFLSFRLLPVQDYNKTFASAYGFVNCAQPLLPSIDEEEAAVFGKRAKAARRASAR